MSEVNERTQRTSLLRGPVTDIPGLTTYLAGLGYATTAYVDDEIGVALGIVASQYFPLAGGTLAGDLDMDAHDIIGAQTINAGSFLKGGLQLATEAFASNASNLVSGTVPDARLSANVARRDQANTFSANQNITGSLTTTDIIVSNSTSGGLHIVNAAMRLVRNVASLLLENQNTGWPIDLSHGNGGTINVVGEQGGLPTLGFSLTRNNRNPDVTAVRNATGPTLETRAAGGLKVCTADGSAVAAVQCSTVTAGVAGTSSGQIIVGHSSSVNAYITVGGTVSQTISGQNNILGVTWQIVTDTTGSGGPASIRLGATGQLGFGSTAANIGTIDANVNRASAGVLQIGTTSNNALGSLNLANLTASGDIVLTGPSRTIIVGNSLPFNYIANYNNSGSMDVSGNSLVTVRTGNVERARFDSSGFSVSGSIRPGQFTVATLPSAAANTGRTVQVTDSSVDFPGNIGNTVAGGGANNVDVKSNGTNWRITG